MSKIEWLSHEDAREFVRCLGLKNREEWNNFCRSGNKPDDIPNDPYSFYKDKGWISWGDFLGTNNKKGGWLSYVDAKDFVGSLDLKNREEWKGYCRSGNKHVDIPNNPDSIYKKRGWISWSDFLGSGTITSFNREYRHFTDARQFAISLGFKSIKKWTEYCKSGNKPVDIPSDPYRFYKDKGWKDWGDFLGTCNIANYNMIYISYEEAKKFAVCLVLKSVKEWKEYCKTGNKPSNIPSNPYSIYKDKGWISWGNFLGTGIIANQNRNYRLFTDAREYVRSLNLKNQKEWNECCKSGNKHDDIPSNPYAVYKDKGWVSWGDFLGTDYTATQNREYRDFIKARKFTVNLGLKSIKEWKEYCKTGNKPIDIPNDPYGVYKDKGWISWGDFLGTCFISTTYRRYKTFEQARVFTRSLGLKSLNEWYEYYKTENKTDDMPIDLYNYYSKDEKWICLADFLGSNNYKNIIWMSYGEARNFAVCLGLKSIKEWKEYCKSGNKPDAIPTNPYVVYKDKGWVSWGDFLGTGNIANYNREFVSFENARNVVRYLGLKSLNEWYEYCKSGNKPDNIPSNPNDVYKDNGWISFPDFFGYTPQLWKKQSIINFFKSIRNKIHILEPLDILIIIKAANMQYALNNIDVLQDIIYTDNADERVRLVDNLEDLISDDIEIISDEECDIEELEKIENKFTNSLTEETTEDIENLTKEVTHGLPEFTGLEDLYRYDDDSFSHYFDDEVAEYFVSKQVNRLWQQVHTNTLPFSINDLRNDNFEGKFFKESKQRFLSQYDGALNIEIPKSFARDFEPSLMQKATVNRLITDRKIGNWSGTGAGKTLSAILAAKIMDIKLTVIICFNSTTEGWMNEIYSSFPDSVVYNKPTNISNIDLTKNNFVLLNYEKFQLYNSDKLINHLLSYKIGFIVLDEIQFAKQRDKTESLRRVNINKFRLAAEEINPDIRVLGMSATPIINNLTESKKILELILAQDLSDVDDSLTIHNAIYLHILMMNNGIRCIPKYNMAISKEIIEIDGTHLLDDILKCRKENKRDIVGLERLLLDEKLKSVNINRGEKVIIYTHYVEHIFDTIKNYYESKGLRVAIFNGDDKSGLQTSNNTKIGDYLPPLEQRFIDGTADILIASSAIGTGVDGLQKISYKMYNFILSWTSAEHEQLIGRIYRQGSIFEKIEIYTPIVKITVDDKSWSWDSLRLKRIQNKKEWSDLVLDGKLPDKKSISPEKMLSEALDSLDKLINKEITISNRETLKSGIDISLLDTISEDYYKDRLSDFSKMNKSWNISKSNSLHNKIKKTPEIWKEYHKLYSERRKEWKTIPYKVIGETIKDKFANKHIADFGCGEDLLRKEYFQDNKNYYSFDHYAISDDVISCDVSNVPLQNDSMDLVICSLSLMSTNYEDYIKEAYRILKPENNTLAGREVGYLIIAEPQSRWSDEKYEQLNNTLISNNFKINHTNKDNSFIYLQCEKIINGIKNKE